MRKLRDSCAKTPKFSKISLKRARDQRVSKVVEVVEGCGELRSVVERCGALCKVV